MAMAKRNKPAKRPLRPRLKVVAFARHIYDLKTEVEGLAKSVAGKCIGFLAKVIQSYRDWS